MHSDREEGWADVALTWTTSDTSGKSTPRAETSDEKRMTRVPRRKRSAVAVRCPWDLREWICGRGAGSRHPAAAAVVLRHAAHLEDLAHAERLAHARCEARRSGLRR